MADDIEPYTISIPDSALSDLKTRLSLAKFPQDELEGAGWDYGAPLDDVKRLTAYWKDEFDWPLATMPIRQAPFFAARQAL